MHPVRPLLALLAVLALVVPAPNAAIAAVRVDGNRLVDEGARPCGLLGVYRAGSEAEARPRGTWPRARPTLRRSRHPIMGRHRGQPLAQRGVLARQARVSSAARRTGGRAAVLGRPLAGRAGMGQRVVLGAVLRDAWRQLGPTCSMPDAQFAPRFWRSVGPRGTATSTGSCSTSYVEPHDVKLALLARRWPRARPRTADDGLSQTGAEVRYRAAGMQRVVRAVRERRRFQPIQLAGSGSASEQLGLKKKLSQPAARPRPRARGRRHLRPGYPSRGNAARRCSRSPRATRWWTVGVGDTDCELRLRRTAG